jgi:hypothetical protein
MYQLAMPPIKNAFRSKLSTVMKTCPALGLAYYKRRHPERSPAFI